MKILKMIVLLLAFIPVMSQGLTEEEKALFKSNVVVPVPSEIIMALDMLSDVNWKEIVEYNYSANYADNYKIALNLGVRVAQGFIAIQAEDRKNTGEMFSVSRDLAENFGADSDMFVDKDEISKLLNENKWEELRSILDDIHLKVKEEMKKYDSDYVTLAGLGGWIEGLHIVSKALRINYTEDASSILYQPELVDHFTSEISKIKDVNKDNPEVKAIQKAMPDIKRLLSVGSGNPIPLKNIEELYKVSSELKGMIVSYTEPEKGIEKLEDPKSMTMYYVIAVVLIIFIVLITRKKGGQ